MSTMIIDVRDAYEFASGHVEGAVNIPPADLMTGAPQLASVAKDTPIILYCRTGARSSVAMNILRGQGFTNLTNGINKDQVQAHYL